MLRYSALALFSVAILHFTGFAQGTYQLAVLKYNGGGDWYGNPTSVPNLVKYCNQQLGMTITPDVPIVEAGSADLFTYPWVHLTGHGNVVISQQEAENLRTYLLAGGFLHISDNYSMDQFIRPMMKRVFPELEFVELPFAHPIYHQKFDFAQGLPKIHEHDGKPAQGFGLFLDGRLAVFYDYESDLGDGWEDPDVHHDPPARHDAALSVHNVAQWVENVEHVLSELDPANAETFEANAAAYAEALAELDTYAEAQLESIPAENRFLVTNHDVFSYFAQEYDFTVLGTVIPSVSTLAETSAGDLTELIATMTEHNVCAIFTETTVNDALAQTVAGELSGCAEVQVLRLYTDAVGPAGSGADSYIGMFRANVAAIVAGLQ